MDVDDVAPGGRGVYGRVCVRKRERERARKKERREREKSERKRERESKKKRGIDWHSVAGASDKVVIDEQK